jgi:acetyltransferase-like isoleucine patch superfamily enzyme
MKAWIKRNFYRLYYYKKQVKFGKNVLLNIKNHFEGRNAIGNNCEIATCSVGSGTYIAGNSIIKNAKIGRFCSIGSNVQTGIGKHPSKVFVSTHPAFFSVQKQAGFSFVDENKFEEQGFIDREKKYVVEIGNDVWIGNNVIIIDGIKIGDGAIVAAGSVVTRDVLPYAIFGGIPSKFIRFRFSERQVETLLKIKWWEWDYDIIKSKSNLFSDIELFTYAVEN